MTALHACNTATDDAIRFALAREARHIVLVPCCQAEVAAEMRARKNDSLSKTPLTEMWRHPIHTRELGSHLTNVLRCLLLESHGYEVFPQPGPVPCHLPLAISPIPRGPLLDVSSPTKLLEYLALGMPCIGNDSPDQAEVLKASGAGLLCRLTPTELAERAIELLDNLPAARVRAASGLDYIRQQRSYSVLGARLAAVYRRLAGESA